MDEVGILPEVVGSPPEPGVLDAGGVTRALPLGEELEERPEPRLNERQLRFLSLLEQGAHPNSEEVQRAWAALTREEQQGLYQHLKLLSPSQ